MSFGHSRLDRERMGDTPCRELGITTSRGLRRCLVNPLTRLRDWWFRPVTDRLDALRGKRPNSTQSVRFGVRAEDVTCNDLAPSLNIGGNPTGPEFCTRPPDHGGWHKGRDGSEWVDTAAVT